MNGDGDDEHIKTVKRKQKIDKECVAIKKSKESVKVNGFNESEECTSNEVESLYQTKQQINSLQESKLDKEIEEVDSVIDIETVSPSRSNSFSRTSAKSFKIMSSIGTLMDSLRTTETHSDDSFVNKTKRKRVRKHKRSRDSAKRFNSSVDTVHEPVSIDTTMLMNKVSPLHLRFSNDDIPETSHMNGNIKSKSSSVTEKAPVYNYCALKDEDFLKYPIMESTLPRAGDVLSFKVIFFKIILINITIENLL